MELEFEMENAPMVAWLSESSESKAIATTGFFASQLFHLINLCIPGEKQEPILVFDWAGGCI